MNSAGKKSIVPKRLRNHKDSGFHRIRSAGHHRNVPVRNGICSNRSGCCGWNYFFDQVPHLRKRKTKVTGSMNASGDFLKI